MLIRHEFMFYYESIVFSQPHDQINKEFSTYAGHYKGDVATL